MPQQRKQNSMDRDSSNPQPKGPARQDRDNQMPSQDEDIERGNVIDETERDIDKRAF